MLALFILYAMIALPGFIVVLVLYISSSKKVSRLKHINRDLVDKLNALHRAFGEEAKEVLSDAGLAKSNKVDQVPIEPVNNLPNIDASTSAAVEEFIANAPMKEIDLTIPIEEVDLNTPVKQVEVPLKVETPKVVQNIPPKKKQDKNTVTNWINICLIFGVSLIVVSTAVFATTNWDYLSTVAKVTTISLGTILMYSISVVASKFKLNSTSNAFHFLGLILLFIDVVALAFFDLLPAPFIFDNPSLVVSLALFVLGLGSIYTCFKFKKYGFVVSSYLIFFMSFMFLILHFDISHFFKILFIIIFNIIVLISGFIIKHKKVYDLVALATIVMSAIFILSLVSEEILYLNDYKYSNMLMYVFGVMVLLTLRTSYTKVLTYLGTAIMLLSSLLFSFQYNDFTLIFTAFGLASIIMVSAIKYFSKSNSLLYDIINYIYIGVALITYISDYSQSSFSYIIVLPIIVILFAMVYSYKVEKIRFIPMIILIAYITKVILISEFYGNSIIAIIVAGLFITLYIVNFFVKKLSTNIWTDHIFLVIFSLIIPLVYFYDGLTILNIILLVSTFAFSIILIFNRKNYYVAQATSISSLLIFMLLVTDAINNYIIIAYSGNVTFGLFTLLGIGSIYLNKLKESRRDLKIYTEGINVFLFVLMIYYLVEFATTADNLLINILINGILGFAVSSFLIKERMYARYLASYALVFYVWYSITEAFTKIASIMSISTFSVAMLYASYTIIALGIIVIAMSQIFKSNKYLQEFKYPVYISTILTLLIYVLGKSDMNIIFILFATLTMYVATYLLISVKIPMWGRSLIAGVWALIFIVKYRDYVVEIFNGYILNTLLIGMVLLIVVSSHFLKKYFREINFVNVFLFAAWIFIFSLDLYSIYVGILLTLYVASLYDCYNFKYYNRSIAWVSAAIFTISILIQNIFYANSVVVVNVFYGLIVLFAIGLCLTQFFKNRVLLEFKYPMYVGMTSVVLSYTIGFHILIPTFTLVSILFMYYITFKIINVKITNWLKSLIAGTWGLLFIFKYINIVTILFEGNMLNVALIGMAAVIIIASQFLRKFFNKHGYINVLLLISWMLFMDVNLPDMYIGLLFSAYIISFYNLYQFKYYNRGIISISVVIFIHSIFMQHYFVIPTNFIIEYFVSEILLISTFLYVLWRNVIPYTQYVLYAIIFMCQLALIIKASQLELYVNATVILVVNVLFMIYSVVKKLFIPFILSIISVGALVIFFTEDLWRSITWWAYLFITGAILITIAVVNEVKIKKSNKSVSSITKEKFKDWEL